MLGLRHQVPVHSPLSAGALARSLAPGAVRRAPGGLRAELAERYEAETVVLCGSGTQALQLALMATGAEEVALPAFTCYEVASAAVGAGVRVRLYDLDPETLAPDMTSLAAALRAGATAVVVAPLYGVPVPWSEVESLAAAHGAVLVEDAAQGHGASWRGQALGAVGEVSVVSFGRGKGWTGGGGGALLLRRSGTRLMAHPDVARLAGAAAPAGARAALVAMAQWAAGRPSVYRLPLMVPGLGLGETRYHPPRAPAGMPGRAAALARATRAQSDAEAARRRESAAELLAAVGARSAAAAIRLPAGAIGGYLRLPVRLPRGLASFAAPERALRLGVGRSYPGTLAELPALAPRLLESTAVPGARQLVRELVTLPTHSRVRGRERAELVRLLAEIPCAEPAGERAAR